MSSEETTYTPSGDENRVTLAMLVLWFRKQLTPRQGTKTTSTQACVISYEPWKQLTPRQGTKTNLATFSSVAFNETTYAPSGDENRCSEAAFSSFAETTYAPSGDENILLPFITVLPSWETTYTPPGDENAD